MIPYAGFLYFGLLLYVAVPSLALGTIRKAGKYWALVATAAMIAIQYWAPVAMTDRLHVRGIWLVLNWALYQYVVARAFLGRRKRGKSQAAFYAALAASLLPLVLTKAAPIFRPEDNIGFLGISYVTFRALDVLFCIHDGVVTGLAVSEYFTFLLFFPTISSGPIDRLRRFRTDWSRERTREEFWRDAGEGMHRIFRGFLYKFILAALIEKYWMDPAGNRAGFWPGLLYMYAYTFYLFFDFAGYSAFAIGVSYFFGIHTPENFDRPFLSKNIREFWNRWHITLSFWFRDHVYMRFIFAALRGKWFKNKHAAAIAGYYLSFGLMGLWHGFRPHFIIYGLYHGTLLSGYDIFNRWNQRRQFWKPGLLSNAAAVLLTFHAFAFGLLIFSGHLGQNQGRGPAGIKIAGVVEAVANGTVVGWAWNPDAPATPVEVTFVEKKTLLGKVMADEFRQDLANGGYGNGRHGFHFLLPGSLRDGRGHMIQMKRGDAPLQGSPWNMAPEAGPNE